MNTPAIRPVLALTALVATSLAAAPAMAADTLDRAALPACVEQHFTPSDADAVARLTVMVLTDAQPESSNLHGLLADKRDAILSETAAIVTRLTEQDCKAEVHAFNASAPSGAVFGLMLKQLMTLGGRSLQGDSAKRAGVVFALDLMKKLDSGVAVDLLGTNGRTATAAAETNPSAPRIVPATSATNL
jgi:hypothetical protein